MITHKEQIEVYMERNYGLNAAELNENVKIDRDVIASLRDKSILSSKANYHAWLDRMEILGGE